MHSTSSPAAILRFAWFSPALFGMGCSSFGDRVCARAHQSTDRFGLARQLRAWTPFAADRRQTCTATWGHSMTVAAEPSELHVELFELVPHGRRGTGRY